jgi:hypothetical protein
MRDDPEFGSARTIHELIKAFNGRVTRTKHYFASAPIADRTASSPSDIFAALESAAPPQAWWTPLHLYEAFPAAVRPPAVIELRDGVHDFEALVSAIPDTYAGTFEQIVCSALWFAEALRRRRRDCGDILCPKQVAWARERVTLYRHVIRLIERRCNDGRPMCYADAAMAIHLAAVGWVKATELGRSAGSCEPAAEA